MLSQIINGVSRRFKSTWLRYIGLSSCISDTKKTLRCFFLPIRRSTKTDINSFSHNHVPLYSFTAVTTVQVVLNNSPLWLLLQYIKPSLLTSSPAINVYSLNICLLALCCAVMKTLLPWTIVSDEQSIALEID